MAAKILRRDLKRLVLSELTIHHGSRMCTRARSKRKHQLTKFVQSMRSSLFSKRCARSKMPLSSVGARIR